MKSFAVLAITAAFASAASAFKHENPELSHPGIEVETRPPVVVVETITLTKSWAPKETGKPHWKPHKYHKESHKDEDEDEDEDDKEGEDEEKKEWSGIHANSFAPKASFNAAQVSSVAHSITSAAASKATSIAAKASSAAASAASSVTASSSGANLRVGGAFVAGAAGIAAYLLL